MNIDSSLYFISFAEMSQKNSVQDLICLKTVFLMNSWSDCLQTGYLGSQETGRPLISNGKYFSYKIKISTQSEIL